MPKQALSGSLEEQCDFLYSVAVEKMSVGNYTGACYALREIVKYAPDYRDAAQLLEEARQCKSTQRFLLIFAICGAALFVGIGSWLRLSNDLTLLVFAAIGGLVGYLVGNYVSSRRHAVDSAVRSYSPKEF